jgi:hypothetical protein
MQTLSGHLTQTNKTHIHAILKANLLEAKVNRINYKLTLIEGVYNVQIAQKSKEYSNGWETSKAKFKI